MEHSAETFTSHGTAAIFGRLVKHHMYGALAASSDTALYKLMVILHYSALPLSVIVCPSLCLSIPSGLETHKRNATKYEQFKFGAKVSRSK